MGNFFGNSTFKDNGCVAENNNLNMAAAALPYQKKTGIVERTSTVTLPKVSQYLSIFEVSAELTVENLHSLHRENNLFSFKTVWNKLGYFPHFPKVASSARKMTENFQETQLTIPSVASIHKDTDRSYKQNLQSNSPAPRLDCIPQLCYFDWRQQIEHDSFFNFTTVVNMVGKLHPRSNEKESQGYMDCVPKRRQGVSFFIDINEPLKRYPLDMDHRFTLCSDCCSISSGDDPCLSECFENLGACYEDDFIVFEEHRFEESDICGFHISVMDYSRQDSQVCFKSECSQFAEQPINSENPDQTSYHPDPVLGKYEQNCEMIVTKSEQTYRIRETSRRVRFQTDENLAVVHHMKHWDFAYREARKGPWELAAADRCRFQRRIKDLETIITPCLQRKLQSIQISEPNQQ